MYWRIESFPEFQHLSLEDRRRVIRECFGHVGLIRWMVRLVGLGAIAGVLAATLLVRLTGIHGIYIDWLLLATVLASIVVFYQLRLIQIRGQLLIYLERMARQQRLPMCLGCGYDLTGLTSDTCPECGWRFAADEKKEN